MKERPARPHRRLAARSPLLAATLLVACAAMIGASCGGASQGPPSAPPATTVATATTSSRPATTASPSPAAPPTPAESATPTPPPPFSASVGGLGVWRRAAMIKAGAWSPRCPVSLDDLRLVTLTYWGFDERAHTGRLVCNRDAVTAIVGALRRLYDERYPIRRMVPVEAYGASDERSMEADNTSAFNGRFVEGSTVWSQHAYGRAIDVDPRENPEIKNGKVYPKNAGLYVDRTRGLPDMITSGDHVVRDFAAEGWGWGGFWHSLKDYQHFSATGT
jgi:D-alanyl-D-alanine carboxypeptidase